MTETVQFSQTIRQWMDTFMHRSMSGWVRYVKAGGFSMPQFMLLMHINYKGTYSISDLSEEMGISTAAVSQLVDKLVQAELLERAEDPNDRRAKQVTLAPKGQELIEQGIKARFRWADDLSESLNPEEKLKISEAFNIMLRVIDEIDHKA